MTISYNSYLVNSSNFPSGFVKLLRRWRGSIYQLIYSDLLVFLGFYYAISICYRFLLTASQKEIFADVVIYFGQYNSKIPLSFVLGFYVKNIMGSWSEQMFKMPYPDEVATFISALIRGEDERSRKMRRTIMRYVNLTFIMVFRMISPKCMKRFPTLDSLKDAGVLTESEKKVMEALDKIYPKLPKYWMPIVWASSVLTTARVEGKIRDDYELRALNDSIDEFRSGCLLLLNYDAIPIPLVYTQVVTLAVYTYFGASVIAAQWVQLDKNKDYRYTLEYYFPLFPTLEFFFFMGWMKVAEQLICPFGDDDDDFEINALIDRNLQVSYMIADEMHSRHPQLIKDQYWDEVCPFALPGGGEAPPQNSTARLEAKMLSPRSSILTHVSTGPGSPPNFHWKHIKRLSSRLIDIKRLSGDSELNPISRKSRRTFQSGNSLETLLDNYGEEEGEEETSEGMTFKKLREKRESQKLERHSVKMRQTMENIHDFTRDLGKKKVRMTVDFLERSSLRTDDERQSLWNPNDEVETDEEATLVNEDSKES